MRKRSSVLWGVFYVLTLGIIVLMISARPELQPTPRHPDAIGPEIAIVGHILTWGPGAFLIARMVVATRVQIRGGRPPGSP